MVQITSNQHRIEIHRAVELLNDFYVKVVKTREKHLIIDVERIIRAFKSRFFQALIDIQEFYEITIVDRYNDNEPFRYGNQSFLCSWNIACPEFHTVSSELVSDKLQDTWQSFQVVLKPKETGLGFSISGGVDNAHVPNDFRIYITKIIPGGAAAEDGQLRIEDIIEKVNGQCILNIEHSSAVSILKQASGDVTLHVLRYKNEKRFIEIELRKKCDSFGFSIAGGRDNQHLPGDNGIFITKISQGGAAYCDGRLRIEDKLIGIKTSHGIELFDNFTHQQAVDVLKAAKDRIVLVISKRMDNTENFKQQSTTKGEAYKKNELPLGISNSPSDQFTADRRPLRDHETIEIIQADNSADQGSLNTVGDVRQVSLSKGCSGFGFTIVGGENGDSIYISSVLEGGSASINGTLRKGDKILTVNGISFKNISHEEAVTILKSSGENIELTVQQDIENYRGYEEKIDSHKIYQPLESIHSKTALKTNERKYMYVRALFSYDPNKDEDLPSTGLLFSFGDILNVTNASDEEWWVASKVTSCDEKCGIIPSRKRWERKQRARDRTVKFEGHPSLLPSKPYFDKRKKNYSFSRKFPFMKNKDDKFDDYPEQEPYMLCYTESDAPPEDASTKEILYRVELPYMEELTLVYLEQDVDDEDAQKLCGEEIILSYEEVEELTVTYTRPIVILGPVKDKINDDLISQYPEKFGSCVPHTTRARREHEIEGCDYHFVLSRDEMEMDIQNHLFIEAGQYNENLYGTSISSIKKVAEEGKHCILDVSGNAIKRLYAARLYPIALLVKVKSAQSLMKILRNITEDQAKILYSRSLKIEQEFSEHFTGIIEGENYEEIYEQIMQIISRESGQKIWIPSKYKQVL